MVKYCAYGTPKMYVQCCKMVLVVSLEMLAGLIQVQLLQGCSGQSVIFDFEITVTYTMISLGFLALKWGQVTDI